MTVSIKDYLGFHGSALKYRSKRADIISSNIANSSTPNFKARDFDTATALRKLGQVGPLTTNSRRHFVSNESGQSTNVNYRIPTMASLDGNTVEMSVEQAAFAENATRYQATLTFLNGRISTLRSAIKGE